MTKLTLKDLPKGTRIYYGGDMANLDGFGTITKNYSDKWGYFLHIKMDDGRDFPSIRVSNFSDHYEGNGLTKFVTEQAYHDWRKESLERYQQEIKRLKMKLSQESK